MSVQKEIKIQFGTLVHLASEPDGLVQRCARCGVVLTDYTNCAAMGEWKPSWWRGFVGVVVELRGDICAKLNPSVVGSMDHDAREIDEVSCVAVTQ